MFTPTPLPIPSVADDWYYNVFGQELGPVPFHDLIELVRAEQISADDQVKLGLQGKWRTVGSIGRLMAVLPYAAKTRTVTTAPRVRQQASSAPIKQAANQQQASVRPQQVARPANDTAHALESRTPRAPIAIVAPHESVPLAVKPSPVAVVPVQPAAPKPPTPQSTVTAPYVRPAVSPAYVARPTKSHQGPGLVATLLEGLQSTLAIRAISAAAVMSLLGYGIWSFAGGPSRPVAVHPVKGKVIIDGEPLANASIVLHRVGDSKVPANLHPRARAAENGTFELETFERADGAPNGEFVAVVLLNQAIEVDGEKQAGPNVLPAVYSRPDTSPLKLKITAATKELQPLELTRK